MQHVEGVSSSLPPFRALASRKALPGFSFFAGSHLILTFGQIGGPKGSHRRIGTTVPGWFRKLAPASSPSVAPLTLLVSRCRYLLVVATFV